jgi:hypothetical protein
MRVVDGASVQIRVAYNDIEVGTSTQGYVNEQITKRKYRCVVVS